MIKKKLHTALSKIILTGRTSILMRLNENQTLPSKIFTPDFLKDISNHAPSTPPTCYLYQTLPGTFLL